jgi:hypothetical protein
MDLGCKDFVSVGKLLVRNPAAEGAAVAPSVALSCLQALFQIHQDYRVAPGSGLR